ncbi:hypothetical protein Glove_326g173 [Diversispora epigaea]|uniref:Arb2 domain-containing protein n=1 Tax=Diversispora epigaea TaxID=1348612 RepID=A0A397HM28_9GLOM|nr:hypothetical protein Glove_326g173 [Diversispora epigaea]
MTESCDFHSYKTIEDFGYKFNEAGELRNIETNNKFNFFVKPGDHSYNQRHYEALGVVIGEYIENELVSKFGLKREIIPVGLKEDDNQPKSRIYLSENALECQNLLLLIQGSGVVRPGQWARQVIMNESLELGSMYPYIQKAQELNWGIVIFNPNNNMEEIKDDEGTSRVFIPGSESLQEHCLYVWDKFINEAKAKHILIVAHSYGGINILSLLHKLDNDFKSRVIAIALTDSVHSSSMVPINSRDWFKKISSNWIKSHEPLGNRIKEATRYYGCLCLSAGHPKHEYTSGTAIEHVFGFLQDRLEKKMNQPEQTEETEQQTEETEQQTEKTEQQTEKTEQQTEKTEQRTEKTEQQTEQTEQQTEQTEQQTEQTEQTEKAEQRTENGFDAEGNKSNSDMDIDEVTTEIENKDKIITEQQNQNNNSVEKSNQNNDSIKESLTEVITEQNNGSTEESFTKEKTNQDNGFIEENNIAEQSNGPTEESSIERTNQSNNSHTEESYIEINITEGNNDLTEESSTEQTNQSNDSLTEESSTEQTNQSNDSLTKESSTEINTESNQNNDDSPKEVHLVTYTDIDSSNESKNHITSEHTSEHDLNLQKSIPSDDISPTLQYQQQNYQPSREEQSIIEDINNGNEQQKSPDNANDANIDQDNNMSIDINQEKDSINNGNEHQQQQQSLDNANNDQDNNMSIDINQEKDSINNGNEHQQQQQSPDNANNDQDINMSFGTDTFNINQKKVSSQELDIDQDTEMSLETDINPIIAFISNNN